MKRSPGISIYLLLFFAVISFSGCDMVHFDRTPGTQLPEFPPEFHGNYISYEIKTKAKTAGIDSSGKFSINTKSWVENNGLLKETFLSERVVFSSHAAYYFLSTKEEDEMYWNCYIIEKADNGFTLYPVVVPNVAYHKQQRILKRYFKEVPSIGSGDRKDKWLVKMNEEQLIKYYQKKLKQLNHYKFEKVN